MRLWLSVLLAASFLAISLSAQDLDHLRAQADSGQAEAQYQLSLRHFAAIGVEKNDDSGLFWLRKAVVQGHSTAQAVLGGWYMKGNRVPRDPNIGIELVRA
ncbi:MAG: tetratricopeptide repeat protein, partial [Planctomycetota bacterium]